MQGECRCCFLVATPCTLYRVAIDSLALTLVSRACATGTAVYSNLLRDNHYFLSVSLVALTRLVRTTFTLPDKQTSSPIIRRRVCESGRGLPQLYTLPMGASLPCHSPPPLEVEDAHH